MYAIQLLKLHAHAIWCNTIMNSFPFSASLWESTVQLDDDVLKLLTRNTNCSHTTRYPSTSWWNLLLSRLYGPVPLIVVGNWRMTPFCVHFLVSNTTMPLHRLHFLYLCREFLDHINLACRLIVLLLQYLLHSDVMFRLFFVRFCSLSRLENEMELSTYASRLSCFR